MESERPIGGIDFPRTVKEFERFFGDEAACREYLVKLRWPSGFCCLRCGSEAKAWVTARGYLHCRDCGAEISVTAGTVFERTRIPLKTWFLAMWLLTSQKHGANALGLQRVLGLGSYQTAWTWLHKLRRAMIRPDRDRLSGCVEVDETFVGGSEKGGKRGRGTENKEIVVIALEIHHPKGFGRVRMKRLPDASGASLIPFICEHIEPGSAVLTDAWSGYTDVVTKGYTHTKINPSDSGDPTHVLMPGVHRIAALLKRWLLGTHQGAVAGKHLDYYLDEYTFRFNRRTSRSRGLLFYRLMQQAVVTTSVGYRQIVHGPECSAPATQ